MKRDLLSHLETWAKHPLRKPLILRGARQVGKSWVVAELGKQFDSYIEINFEKDKSAINLFEGDIHIPQLVEKISLYTGKKLEPGKTLLFLDEIQESQSALLALRYFKEELPDLHIIAAGSLIDFALEKSGMPVGRVQFMYLHPLSFCEFLVALGREDLRIYIEQQQIDKILHLKILELLRTYLWLGGMPAVVDAWLSYHDVSLCQELQNEIITAYSQDFHKYAREKQIEYVEKIFAAVPSHLGNKFKFSHIDRELRSLPLKTALLLLEKAGIVHLCYHSSGQQQPLGAQKDEKKFKAYFFDVGLAQRMLGVTQKDWILNPLTVKNLGAIAEQFVAQEIIAYTAIKSQAELYYWHREAKGSNAEIDFLMSKNSDIVPVEVKSGEKGSMKSLHLFLETHANSSIGLKISEDVFCKNGWIEEIPLYGIESWVQKPLG